MSEPQTEMPKYKCHKEVHGLRIERLVTQVHPREDSIELRFLDEGYAPIVIDAPDSQRIQKAMIDHNRHREEGEGLDTGYYVVYKGGYKSWSPTEEFEEGYTRI